MLSANILFFYALSKRKVAEISFYYYIQPVVAVAIAWLILNEKLSLAYAMGAVVVLVGIFIAQTKKRTKASLDTL